MKSKKKMIIEIVGKAIEKYGFTYGLDKAYSGSGVWGFAREINSIKQMIIIQQYFGSALFLNLCTTAWGQGLGKRVGSGVPLPKGEYSISAMDLWIFEDEDEFRKILFEFVDIIEKYGIEELNKMSVEDETIPTIAMADRVFSTYKALSEQFIKRHQIDPGDMSKEAVSKWFEIIEKQIVETKDEPYESVQDMLVEIAAFLGEQLRKDMGGEWIRGLDVRHVYVTELNGYLFKSFFALGKVIETWKNQDINDLKEFYLIIRDNKLPLTVEQQEAIIEKLRLWNKKDRT